MTRAGGKPPQGRRRGGKVHVRTARGRKPSSTRWLQRQLNDPYVAEAKRRGFRSRAAFKLMEMDDRFGLLKDVHRVVDLGAAPGGWLQVLTRRLGRDARIVGLDFLDVEPVPGAVCLKIDFLDPTAPERLKAELGGAADLVLSDMAAATTGHKQTDHLRTMALCEAALDFAADVLAPGGSFLAKVLQGGTDDVLLARMKGMFRQVRHLKPPASRSDSVEWYVLATGFRGPDAQVETQGD